MTTDAYDRKAKLWLVTANEYRTSADDCIRHWRFLFATELILKAERYEALAKAYRTRDMTAIQKFEDEMALLSKILE